jgi:uncharacterized UPF0160 family protein
MRKVVKSLEQKIQTLTGKSIKGLKRSVRKHGLEETSKLLEVSYKELKALYKKLEEVVVVEKTTTVVISPKEGIHLEGEINVVTHNGVFHADEVTAVALFAMANPNHDIVVTRIGHQDDFDASDYDYVVDVGRKYDGEKFFDHHQDRELPASNKLVYNYLVENRLLEDCHVHIMEEISNHDVGIKQSILGKELAYLNAQDIYGEEQMKKFSLAVKAVVRYLQYGDFGQAADDAIVEGKKVEQEKIAKEKAIIDSCLNFEGLEQVLEMPRFLSSWKQHINGEVGTNFEVVVWYDDKQNNWQAQVVPVNPTSFERVGKGFTEKDEDMTFIHVGKFFCVAPTREVMFNYLKKCNFE